MFIYIYNYLLSTDDDNFYIKVNSNKLSIKVNTDTKIIANNFIADNWYHLALIYNDSYSRYDIYIDQLILSEKIDNLISKPITLNIGKNNGKNNEKIVNHYKYSSLVDDVVVILPSLTIDEIIKRHSHLMVAIGTDIYIYLEVVVILQL